jgi:hypothetical protein
MTIWKKEGRPDIEEHDDGTWWQEGKETNPLTAEKLEANGWREHIPEPEIEMFGTGASAAPPGKAKSIIMGGLNTVSPMRAAMSQAGRDAWAQFTPNSKALQEAGAAVGGTAGAAADVLSYLFSPAKYGASLATPAIEHGISLAKPTFGKLFDAVAKSKPVQAAGNAIGKLHLEKGVTPGGEMSAGKTLPWIGGKNVAQNTADAAVFNNAERLAKGEDMELGAAELAGGALGGAAGAAGEKKVINDVMRARNAATKVHEHLNFAEHATNKKGLASVEQIIKENVAKHGTFTKAVDNIRLENDKLNNEMAALMEASGLKEIPYPAQELRDKIDNYVLGKTSFLGNKHSRENAAAALESFDNAMKEIWIDRQIKNAPEQSRRAISDMAHNMTPEQLQKEIPTLTLGEFDRMKRDMQKRSSHWQRSQGSMAREGVESLANKEASSALNNILDDVAEMTEHEFTQFADKIAGSLPPADAKRFREINKARSNAIGNLKIMELADRVQGRRDDFITSLGGAALDWNAKNKGMTSSLNWHLAGENSPFAQFLYPQKKEQQ